MSQYCEHAKAHPINGLHHPLHLAKKNPIILIRTDQEIKARECLKLCPLFSSSGGGGGGGGGGGKGLGHSGSEYNMHDIRT